MKKIYQETQFNAPVKVQCVDELPTWTSDDKHKVLRVDGGNFYFGGESGWESAVAPVGSLLAMPVTDIPEGYLECDGSQISMTVYPELYAVLGLSYGPGDGETTFQLPDYRGWFLRGWDHGIGVDPDAADREDGGSGQGLEGDTVGSRQGDEFAEHTHNAPTGSIVGTEGTDHPDDTYEVPPVDYASEYDYGYAAPVSATGGNETRPKNIYVMYCIKY